MADLEQILAKISALLNKTTAAGATEAEAFAAAAKARELIDKYQLAAAGAEATPGHHAAGMVYLEALPDLEGHTWRVGQGLAKFTDCKIWLSGLGRARLPNGSSIPGKIKLLGLRSDVELAHWLLTAIAGFARSEFLNWMLDAEVADTKSAKESFYTAFSNRVVVRLLDLSKTREPSATSLVVVKTTAQDKWMKENGVNLHRIKNDPFGVANGREQALRAGGAAGDRAPIGKSMTSGRSTPKLTGPA